MFPATHSHILIIFAHTQHHTTPRRDRLFNARANHAVQRVQHKFSPPKLALLVTAADGPSCTVARSVAAVTQSTMNANCSWPARSSNRSTWQPSWLGPGQMFTRLVPFVIGLVNRVFKWLTGRSVRLRLCQFPADHNGRPAVPRRVLVRKNSFLRCRPGCLNVRSGLVRG